MKKNKYHKSERDEEEERDPVKFRYQLIAWMNSIEKAKKDMNDFKQVKRITIQFKELAIRSYCRHNGVSIPVHTWKCLQHYGYTPVSEKEMYKLYKIHYNRKMKLYEEIYNIEKSKLNKMLL